MGLYACTQLGTPHRALLDAGELFDAISDQSRVAVGPKRVDVGDKPAGIAEPQSFRSYRQTKLS